jgi:hypothetical protein
MLAEEEKFAGLTRPGKKASFLGEAEAQNGNPS